MDREQDSCFSMSVWVERDCQCFCISLVTMFRSSSSLLMAITRSNAFLFVFISTESAIHVRQSIIQIAFGVKAYLLLCHYVHHEIVNNVCTYHHEKDAMAKLSLCRAHCRILSSPHLGPWCCTLQPQS